MESDKEIAADIEPPPLDDEVTSNSEENKTSRSIVWWIMLFVNVFQTLHFISDQVIVGTKSKGRPCSHWSFSRVCGGLLVKEVITLSGNMKFYPHSVYCYKSVIDTMQGLINRTGFADACESTRDLYTRSRICDIYQGQVWKDFVEFNGREFF